jgi:hypothetical protein
MAHFGLGKDRSVQLLEVIWPSGVRQSLSQLAVDRYITIEEPH